MTEQEGHVGWNESGPSEQWKSRVVEVIDDDGVRVSSEYPDCMNSGQMAKALASSKEAGEGVGKAQLQGFKHKTGFCLLVCLFLNHYGFGDTLDFWVKRYRKPVRMEAIAAVQAERDCIEDYSSGDGEEVGGRAGGGKETESKERKRERMKRKNLISYINDAGRI